MASSEKREIVSDSHQEYQITTRRSCGRVKLTRSIYFDRPRPMQRKDSEIGEVLTQWAEAFPYFGFWMLCYRLRLFNYKWNNKPVYWVYKALDLHLRRRPKRKLPRRDPPPMKVPDQIDDNRSMDFCSDYMAGGRTFRVLNIIEDFRPREESCSREALAAEADTSLSAKRLIRILDQLIEHRTTPKYLRVDNGPEFIAKIMKQWADQKGLTLAFITPGKPTQNGFVERLNGTLRREVLDRFWFSDLEEVSQRIDEWMIEYNRFRPHKGLGYLSPDLFVQQWNRKLDIQENAA